MSLLLDAQTSGGLLIALPESALAAFASAMKAADAPWWRVGRVAPQSAAQVRLI